MVLLLNIIKEVLSFQACVIISGLIAIICIAIPLGVSLLRVSNSRRMSTTKKGK